MSGDSGLILLLVAIAAAFGIWLAVHAQKRPRDPAVLVCGATGVGKSTLINALAQRQVADTGIGSPVTQNAVRLDVPERQFIFYDSRGLEVEEASQTYLLLLSDLLRLRYNANTRAQIDLVLMCIPDPQNRYDEAHREIANLCEDLQIPYGVAMTKWEGDEELMVQIRKLFTSARFIAPVRALELRTSRVVIPTFGLEKLEDELRRADRWDWRAARERAASAIKAEQLSKAARELAATQGRNQQAWVQFGASALTLLTQELRPWSVLISQMRNQARRTYVPNFMVRNLLTKFDYSRIDGTNASHLVPFILRRFGDGSKALRDDDVGAAWSQAMQALKDDRPYRSRL